MSTLTGTWTLTRFTLRRDRFLLPLWIILIGLVPVALAPGISEIWPDQAARDNGAQLVNHTPAFTALMGKVHDPSLGGLVAWRGSLVPLILAMITAVTLIRHTRTDEEVGRRELLGANVMGRHAQLAAAVIVTAAASLVIGGLVAAGMIGENEAVTGSILLGAQYAAAGLVFAGVAAVCAQLTTGAGAARGIFFIVLGAGYLFRMTADLNSSLSWLRWATPVGWLEALEPYAANRWEVLALLIGTFVVLVGVAFALQSRRDIEAGILPTRLGRSTAPRSLSNSLGLAWRIQRAALLGWAIGFALMGALLGSMVHGIKQTIESSPVIRDMMTAMGGSDVLTDAFVASMLGILGLVASGYGIQAIGKLRSEETRLHAEQTLATSVSRWSWMGSHLLFGMIGSVVVLAAGGVAFGLTYGLAIDDLAAGVRDSAAGWLIQIPAVWVLSGFAMLLFGLIPKLLGLAWVALAMCLVCGQLGAALRLPQWALNLSPFTHLPQLPGNPMTWQPVLWLTGIAAVITVVGAIGLRRRDLG